MMRNSTSTNGTYICFLDTVGSRRSSHCQIWPIVVIYDHQNTYRCNTWLSRTSCTPVRNLRCSWKWEKFERRNTAGIIFSLTWPFTSEVNFNLRNDFSYLEKLNHSTANGSLKSCRHKLVKLKFSFQDLYAPTHKRTNTSSYNFTYTYGVVFWYSK